MLEFVNNNTYTSDVLEWCQLIGENYGLTSVAGTKPLCLKVPRPLSIVMSTVGLGIQPRQAPSVTP
jgi:hypothetical protein